MLYLRITATAAGLLLLGGCSFSGFWNQPETPAETPKIDSHDPGGPFEGSQLAALPGYLSDQDVAPTRPTAVFQGRPTKPILIFDNLLPRRPVLDLQPMASAFEPSPHSLADLIADRDWRKRTSETLNRLFQ